MRQFHNLLKRVLVEGEVVEDPRTKVHTIGISGHQYSVDLRKQFPLHTTRKISPKLAAEELLWKLRGERSVKSLVERSVNYWTQNAFQKHLQDTGRDKSIPKHTPEWAKEFVAYQKRLSGGEESGDLGPVYGYNWRHGKDEDGKEVDQLANLLRNLKDPEKRFGRYNILDAWDAPNISKMAIGPCPFWQQFIVKGEFMDLHEVQRSCDSYLGVPYNDAQDAILAHLVANETGLIPRNFTHTFIDTHIYTGVPPRSYFWDDESKVQEFKVRVNGAMSGKDFLVLRDWYLRNAPGEQELDKGKDHTPDVLTQLSYEPKRSARLELKDVPLMEAIQLPSYRDVLSVKDYKPHKWESSSVMAA
ncbi:MAG: thymidylate synthase [Nanoarchaeota archaeon]|nr:thymidylate synthase [Nanoarchaeota archaeon]MBU2459295.1 thymidylate synthase [Nanoarchaeota archaeon]